MMNRRTMLKGGIVLAATAHTAALAPIPEPPPIDWAAFFATASPAELCRFHSNGLAEAMNAVRPGAYIAVVNHDYGFATVTDYDWQGKPKIT